MGKEVPGERGSVPSSSSNSVSESPSGDVPVMKSHAKACRECPYRWGVSGTGYRGSCWLMTIGGIGGGGVGGVVESSLSIKLHGMVIGSGFDRVVGVKRWVRLGSRDRACIFVMCHVTVSKVIAICLVSNPSADSLRPPN